jgi:hypothetical protein
VAHAARLRSSIRQLHESMSQRSALPCRGHSLCARTGLSLTCSALMHSLSVHPPCHTAATETAGQQVLSCNVANVSMHKSQRLHDEFDVFGIQGKHALLRSTQRPRVNGLSAHVFCFHDHPFCLVINATTLAGVSWTSPRSLAARRHGDAHPSRDARAPRPDRADP